VTDILQSVGTTVVTLYLINRIDHILSILFKNKRKVDAYGPHEVKIHIEEER
jgi:hypothetical protein